jgi:hypothetical protein
MNEGGEMVNGTSGSQPGRSRRYIAAWIVEVGLVVFWIAVAIGIGQATIDRVGPFVLWGVTMVFMVVLLALAGHEINGQWFGVLIDSRNKVSLSRLQITLWTVLVLSTYLTVALPRVTAMVGANPSLNAAQALDIRFPDELIVAMGISAVSFAGSSLIKSNKKGKQIKVDARLSPDAAQARRDQAADALKGAEATLLDAVKTEGSRKSDLEQAREALKKGNATQAKVDMVETLYNAALIDKDQATKDRDAKKKALDAADDDLADILATQGLLHKNADPSEARWVDLFRGEEISNFKLVDMSKVQMLFFTVVIIAAYAAAISSLLRDLNVLRASAFVAFPGFSESLNFLLGISHGTYLSVKTIDQA